MHKRYWVILILLLILPSLSQAKEWFVQSKMAPMWDAPSFQAKQIGLLGQGEAIEEIKTSNGWVQVRYKGQNSWMLQLMLSPTPIPAMVIDEQKMQTFENRARCRPSAFTSTAAARGLVDKSSGFGEKFNLDFDAVKVMESWQETDQAAREFMAKGKGR